MIWYAYDRNFRNYCFFPNSWFCEKLVDSVFFSYNCTEKSEPRNDSGNHFYSIIFNHFFWTSNTFLRLHSVPAGPGLRSVTHLKSVWGSKKVVKNGRKKWFPERWYKFVIRKLIQKSRSRILIFFCFCCWKFSFFQKSKSRIVKSLKFASKNTLFSANSRKELLFFQKFTSRTLNFQNFSLELL